MWKPMANLQPSPLHGAAAAIYFRAQSTNLWHFKLLALQIAIISGSGLLLFPHLASTLGNKDAGAEWVLRNHISHFRG
jgi:Ni/Fe-hydrogenase subunit HybB-like protein